MGSTAADVLMLVGCGALGATDELEQMAERLGAPIIKALLAKLLCLTIAHTPPEASDYLERAPHKRRWKIVTRY